MRLMTKHTKEKIRNYILDCIDLSGRDKYAGVQLSEKDRVKAVYEIFKSEYGHQLKYYGGNEQKTFENWLMGLPSCFNIDYENHKILELTRMWGLLPEGSTESKKQQTLDLWWGRIYMQFRMMLNQK